MLFLALKKVRITKITPPQVLMPLFGKPCIHNIHTYIYILEHLNGMVRASEWNSVVMGSNPTQVNFIWLLQKSFSDEYHIY